jgi:hypothetical protein
VREQKLFFPVVLDFRPMSMNLKKDLRGGAPGTSAPPSFLEQLRFWIGLLVVIHILPKDATPGSTTRLLLTIAFFVTIIRLCFLAMEPRNQFMKQLYAWRFEDCPPHLERAWRRVIHELDCVLTTVAFLLLVLIACLGMQTMNYWFAGLDDLAGIYKCGWWIAFLGLFGYLASGSLHDALQAVRALRRELALCEGQEYQPRPWSDYWKPAPSEAPPVKLLGPQSFSAGGIDWRWEDFTPNCVIFGQTKSGKTSCVLNAVLDGILGSSAAAKHPPGALIMDPKGDFLEKIGSVCRKWGRERDLKILDLDLHAAHPTIRWNPLDSSDDEFELAARCGTVMEMLGMRETQSSYWLESSRQFIAQAITLLRLTNPDEEPPSFAEIGRLSTYPRELMERLARLDEVGPVPKARACLDYFADVWLALDDKLRTDIMTFIRNIVQPFLRQPYAPIFTGRSTLSIAQMIDSGAVFYLNLPTARHPAMSRAVGTFVKLEYFQEVRRRLNKPRPTFYLCDEFSEFVSFGVGQPDASFFAMSRQSNHANIVAVQNMNSFLMHSRDEAPVLNLLGNCAVKVFLRNTDQKTNQYASDIHGQEIVEAQGVTLGARSEKRLGRSANSITGTDQLSHVLRPEVFTRLKVPGTEPGTLYTESIIHLGSRHDVSLRGKKTRWPVHPLSSAHAPLLPNGCAPDKTASPDDAS